MLARIKSIAGQSAIYGLGNLLPKAIGFLLIPLYTQFLSPADYGILSFATTLLGLTSIFMELGLRNSITRFHYEYLENLQQQRIYYGTVWLSLMLFPLLPITLLAWQGEFVFSFLFKEIPFETYGWLILGIAYLNLASIVPLVLFQVRRKAGYYISLTLGRFLLNTLAIIYFVSIQREGAQGSLKGQFFSALLFSIPFTWISLHNLDLKFDLQKLKSSLAFGVPLIPHQLSGWALSVFDRLLLERYVSLADLGLYSLGYRVASILDLILSSFNLAWSPFFYRTAKEEQNAPETFARLTTYYMASVFFLAIGISTTSKEVIMLISKPDFWQAYKVVPVITLAFVASGMYYMNGVALFYTKKTKNLPLFTGVAALVNIGLNLVFMPKYGIFCAAWTTVIGYIISASLVYRETRKLYPIPFEYKRLGGLLLSAIPFYIGGIWLDLGNIYLTLVAKLVFVCLFPAFLLISGFFTRRERTGMQIGLTRLFFRLFKHKDNIK